MSQLPSIIYPKNSASTTYPAYSYFDHPIFPIYIQLPEVLSGTSGSPAKGDNVYSDLKLIVNNGTPLTYSDLQDYIIGTFAYLEKIVIILDTENLGITAGTSYTIKLSVKQTYGGIDQFGGEVTVSVAGSQLESVRTYSGSILHDTYLDIWSALAGYIENYTPLSASNLDAYKKNQGEVIETSDFSSFFSCVESAVDGINDWIDDITTAATAIIDDSSLIFNPVLLTKITSAKSGNYIEQMYDWLASMYTYIISPSPGPTPPGPTPTSLWLIRGVGSTDCEVIRYLGSDATVTVPDTIEDKTVIGLDSTAFLDTNVTSVTLPNTLQYIN